MKCHVIVSCHAMSCGILLCRCHCLFLVSVSHGIVFIHVVLCLVMLVLMPVLFCVVLCGDMLCLVLFSLLCFVFLYCVHVYDKTFRVFSYLNTEGSYNVSCFLLRSIRKIWLPNVSPAESCWDKEELLATRNITFILPTLYSDPDDESSSLFKRILGIAGADLWTIALKLVGNCSLSFSELSRPPPSVALLFWNKKKNGLWEFQLWCKESILSG